MMISKELYDELHTLVKSVAFVFSAKSSSLRVNQENLEIRLNSDMPECLKESQCEALVKALNSMNECGKRKETGLGNACAISGSVDQTGYTIIIRNYLSVMICKTTTDN